MTHCVALSTVTMRRKLKVAIIAIITIITIITTIAHCPSPATNTRPSTSRQEAPEASLKLPITYIAQQEASIKLPTTYCRHVLQKGRRLGSAVLQKDGFSLLHYSKEKKTSTITLVWLSRVSGTFWNWRNAPRGQSSFEWL